MKPQAWSWLIVESAMPLTRAARSRTQASWRAVTWSGSKPPHRFQAVLMASHSSVETVSRARRAFSRAARQAPAIELECSSSKTSRSQTVAYETGASPGSRPMITWRMTRAVISSDWPVSSSICSRAASTIRAVPSARST